MPPVPVNPAYFLAAVTELVRIGEVGWKQWREHAFQKDLRFLLPVPPDKVKPQDMESFAVRTVFLLGPEAWRPVLGDVFEANGDGILKDGLPLKKLADIIDFGLDNAKLPIVDPQGPKVRPSSIWVMHKWAQKPDSAPSSWERLALGLTRFSLAMIAARPDAIGARGRVEGVLTAVASQINQLLPEEAAADAKTAPFGERALELFANATLTTLMDRPDLFVSDDKLAKVAGAMLQPLGEAVRQDGTLEMPALARLGRLLRGPMAHGALAALSEQADGVLKGEFSEDRILGAVTRTILSEIATTRQGDFDLLTAFGEAGSAHVFKAALTTAKSRPELFIGGKGESKDAARMMLRGVAEKLRDAPYPFNFDGGLGADIAAVGMDAAALYLRGRLLQDARNEKDWPEAGAKVAALVVGEIFDGFKLGLKNRGGYNPFQHLFDRDTAVSVVKLIATAVAETPGMVIDEKASGEVRNMAAAVARFVAMDTTRLMRAEDWRAVIGVALAEASKNPGVLFDINPSESPEKHVAVRLISSLLSKAELTMRDPARKPGKLLFGETLREAAVATLKAAANTASHLSESDMNRRVVSLEAFIDRLQKMAESGVPGVDGMPAMRIGSDEWLYVYRWYVAHLIDTGDISKITDQSIREVLLGIATRPKPGASA
jgi:hypothetical protein